MTTLVLGIKEISKNICWNVGVNGGDFCGGGGGFGGVLGKLWKYPQLKRLNSRDFRLKAHGQSVRSGNNRMSLLERFGKNQNKLKREDISNIFIVLSLV